MGTKTWNYEQIRNIPNVDIQNITKDPMEEEKRHTQVMFIEA